jgi:hypothetical protein
MPCPCKDATDIGKNPSWEIASAHFHHVALDSCMSDSIFSATIDANNDREFAFTQDAEKQRQTEICEAPSELDSDGKSDRSTLRFRIARRYCSVAISQQHQSEFVIRRSRTGGDAWGGGTGVFDRSTCTSRRRQMDAWRHVSDVTVVVDVTVSAPVNATHISLSRSFDFYNAKAQGFIIINESASDEQQASENKKGFSDAPILRCFFRDP